MKAMLLALGLVSSAALAQATFTVETPVVVRDASFEARLYRRPLVNLLGRDRIEGVHFKVVNGKSETPVSFSDDPEIVMRAATAYYHLSLARDFFVRTLNSEYVASMPQLVIRVNLTNQYNDLGHFAHDNNEPQYNNALTVPAGEGLAGRGIRPWGTEIWFRPQKRTHIRDLNVRDPGIGSWGALISQFREQTRMTTLQRFMGQAVQSATNENAPSIGWDSVLRTGGTVLMLELVAANAEPLSRLFSRKIYWLDTALVPEIIYHEYAHVALSDKLLLSHSTAVIEGMADFFAGRIANSAKLALDIGRYNTFNGKKATRSQMYQV